ncbi:uncharacterized protein BYT42DRAFT_181307 [Radiomyces spectabilis]|uniref:uncharacterized protein n=1 Tax=Radiomyces spectabilis TaxID=64574 RepID=UPI00221F1103|nr:uncharacterized protein BYT42DRAFT_181307 [Radiomyces spectabilis]KAI8391082.1 hypothetical protein BYT42DRAFT_181307 [Radiomyces spectabilis]
MKGNQQYQLPIMQAMGPLFGHSRGQTSSCFKLCFPSAYHHVLHRTIHIWHKGCYI